MNRELSGREIVECELKARQFLKSENDELIEINSLNEVNEYFRIFKEHIKILNR